LPHYFLLHEPFIFERQIVPAFAMSWKINSFEPLATLAAQMKPGITAFGEKFRMGADAPILEQLAGGMKFDKAIWEMALAEALFYGAKEAPDSPTSFTSLRFLLGSPIETIELNARSNWPWIERAVLGSRTLRLGRGVYRPREAGWNSPAEAGQLATQLHTLDSGTWNPGQLTLMDASLDEEDRADELALAVEALAGLRTIYDRAVELEFVVFCEQIV
jgi:hypothetical protein